MTKEELYARYQEVLLPGDLDNVSAGWMGIIDQYFAVVAPLMHDTGYEVVWAKEVGGGLDWTWTSRLGAMTAERHEIMDHQDTLLDLRSYHTCRVCGQPGVGYKADDGTIQTACEEHGMGTRITERKTPFVRTTRDGFVQYDAAADDLVVVWHPAGNDS